MSRSTRGFTFVEILCAMAVFGALTAIALPRYRTYKDRAYMANMKTELGSLRIAEEAYWAEHMVYSTDTTQLDWNGSERVQIAISSSNLNHGFSAVATHTLQPALICQTWVGREATTTASGDIICSANHSGNPGSAVASP